GDQAFGNKRNEQPVILKGSGNHEIVTDCAPPGIQNAKFVEALPLYSCSAAPAEVAPVFPEVRGSRGAPGGCQSTPEASPFGEKPSERRGGADLILRKRCHQPG